MADKRKRGGQPGNHNALKHGRYIARENLPVQHTSFEEQLTLVDHLIPVIKRQMSRALEEDKSPQSLQEILKTMNTLSMAAIGLCRLLNMHHRLARYADGLHNKNELMEQNGLNA